MKKKLLKIISFCLLNILILTTISCKKGFDINNVNDYPNLEYRISGFYIKAIGFDEAYSVSYPDPNLKAYFDYSTELLNTYSGSTGYYVQTSGQKRTIEKENNVIKVAILSNFTFSSLYEEDELEVYLIYQNKDNTFTIDQSSVQKVKINKERCSLYTTFTYQKQKYQFSISIGLYKE